MRMIKLKETYFNIKYGIQNLIKWFPVIWRDRDWDQTFLLAMLEKKLSNMSDLHKEYGNKANSDETSRQLKRLANLASRISNENYMDEAFKGKEYLLEKNEMVFVDIGNGTSKIEFVGLSHEEREELRRLYNVMDELPVEDIEELFDTMKKNIRYWWD